MNAASLQRLDGLDQRLERATQAVQSPDDDRIPWPGIVEHGLELGTIVATTAHHIAKDLRDTRFG